MLVDKLIKWEMFEGHIENAEVCGRSIGFLDHKKHQMKFMDETYLSADKEIFKEFFSDWLQDTFKLLWKGD